MPTIPRLNNVIRALENGQSAITTFVSPPTIENAVALSRSSYDGVIFEAEHNPYDIKDLRDCFQYMLDRRQIIELGTPVAAVTPLVRIPPNGGEMSQWLAKQVLDVGAYGIVWPHIADADQAHNAVAACRYPRPPSAPYHEPKGLRGDAPAHAARYWGLTQHEYYSKADVWPLNPQGEILVVIMCESVRAIDNLPEILKVPGIGVVLIGEGDLSQDLGHPRQYEHPAVIEAMTAIRRICKERDIPCGHPHVDVQNAERIAAEGYRFLLTSPARSFDGLETCLKITGRRGK